MDTDWSALLKAIFGSAYMMSDLINHPDVASISGCQQQRDCRHRAHVGLHSQFPTVDHFVRVCDVSASKEVCPCDVTMTSFPVSVSGADCDSSYLSVIQHRSTETCWNAAADCSEIAMERNLFDYKKSFSV